ncbi:DegV family protein [Corynebacterium glyciniphilum]|uniref:DegV family protein n=1 Tax=Corynebacterium glyciniphilum TaxID=1404244 RepID=UPI0026503BFD|nr:DegV family protein [Corynebacterium glyciniphilum]MDN5684213.1 DegV family protein [Corynebacterium glyciniphilum]MDN6704663.1 DegV family protein [Corynebacterium glyciniphilum]
MSVLVVTDSSACLPPVLATEYGITVLDFHAEGEGDDETTAGLGALELTACYARLLERGGDDGVVALHISKELSGTWSSASQAAAVLDGRVEVIETMSGGMVIGQAAIAAARCADDGGSLDECRGAAQHAIDTGQLWLFVNRLDTLARGGRLTAGQRLLSTALAIKPIMHLAGGRLELAAKTRTRSKAMERMVTLATNAYRDVAEALLPTESTEQSESQEVPEPSEEADTAAEDAEPSEGPVATAAETDVVVAANGDAQAAGERGRNSEHGEHGTGDEGDTGTADGADRADGDVSDDEDGEDSSETPDRPRIFSFGGRDKPDRSDKPDKGEKPEKTDKSEKPEKSDKSEHERLRLRRRAEEQVPLRDLPRVPMHLAVHHREAEDAAEELRANLREQLPECVVISVVDISHAMAVHTGPGALAVSMVQD